MSTETTPNLSLPLMIRNQSGKEVTHNEALVIIDVLLNNGIIDKDLSTPPTSPNEGDTYIVNTTATGDWLNQEGKIAFYNNGWRFIAPKEGFTVWINDENLLYSHTGSSWQVSGGSMVGVLNDLNDVEITTPTQYDLLSHNGTNFINTKEIQANNLTLSGLTASKIVETNISKKLISADKNTAYNKNFGIISGTICEGNDARLSDARTPLVHSLASAEHNADTLANLNTKISDATLIDTNDTRLSNSRKCDNTFDNIITAKTNLSLENVDNTLDVNKPISNTQQTALDLKANDNEVIKLTGNQTILGEKDFTTGIKIASSNLLNGVSTGITNNNKITTQGYVDDVTENLFNQNLNTTDSPTFVSIYATNLTTSFIAVDNLIIDGDKIKNGTNPIVLEKEDLASNSISEASIIRHGLAIGTGDVGIGTSQSYQAPNNAGVDKKLLQIITKLTDSISSVEDSYTQFKTLKSGAEVVPMVIDRDYVLNPLNPHFDAYKSATSSNVIGGSASYTVIFDTEVEDIGGNYDNTTGIFTAPVDGIYNFNACITVYNPDSTNTIYSIDFVSTSRAYNIKYTNLWTRTKAPNGLISDNGSVEVKMNAGDTMKIQIYCNGNLTADLYAGSLVYFNGGLKQ